MLKTLKGLGLVLLALLLFTCEKDAVYPGDQELFETATESSIKALFKSTDQQRTTNDSAFTITPDWDTLAQEELVFTDALLTHLQASIASNGGT